MRFKFGEGPQPGFQTAVAPVPQVEIKTSLAPGKRGPIGMGPRNDFSKVNTGTTPAVDTRGGAGDLAPDSAGMLQKRASEGSMGSMAARPTLHEMVKKAMAGAVKSVDIGREASRQATSMGEKTASASAQEASTSGRKLDVEKLAGALDFVASELRKEGASLGGAYHLTEHKGGVGTGPGALKVTESAVPGKDPITPNSQGHGHTAQVGPGGALQKSTPAGPQTQMENDKDHAPGGAGHQPLAMVNQKTGSAEKKCEKCGKEKCSCGDSKMASAIRERFAKVAGIKTGSAESQETAGMAEAKKGLEKAEAAHKSEPENKKEASGFLGLATAMFPTVKVAEDAINPAKISAGAAVPPDTREAGQAGGIQAKGSGPGMVSSNKGAIDYKKGTAKAEAKNDSNKYWTEPALSGGTDKTLAMSFKHTGEAGTKFASAEGQTKTAAARALLSKLAEAAEEKKNAEKGS